MPNIYNRYLPTGLLDMARDAYQKPSKFARGLLGPAYDTVRAIPEFLPGAGMYESKVLGKQAADQFRRNNYLAALGLLGAGMGTAALDLVPGGAAAGGAARTVRRAARQQPTMPSAMMREDTGGGFQGSPPPVPAGAAPDRTTYSLRRFAAPQGDSARIQRLEEKLTNQPELADDLRRIVRAGEDIGREWYNTEELRDMFIAELGKKKGDEAWREYLTLVGATSTGSKVPPNIRNASYYFTENRPGPNKGPDGLLTMQTDELIAGDRLPPKGSGYGHKMQRNQAKNVGNYYAGDWGATADPRLNPKPRGFTQSLLGSAANIAADKHFMRLMAMKSDDPDFLHTSAEVSKETVDKLRDRFGKKMDAFITERTVNGKPAYNFNAKAAVQGKRGSKTVKAAKPIDGMFDFIKDEKIRAAWADMPQDNEYAAFERMVNKLAEEMDMTGPQLQAAFWMGAARETGVDPSSQYTFMQIFKDIVRQRAEERGISEKQVFKNFAKRAQPLVLPIAAAGSFTGLLGSNEE